jgi:uracil permease
MKRLPIWQECILGIQMMFVAFGALVLVPILVGLDISVALFTAGVGTLIFQYITKWKIPIFLASSFAYIAPIIAATEIYGMNGMLCGLAAAGIGKIGFGLLIKKFGVEKIKQFLPPVIVGPMIIIIGLSLAPVAIDSMMENVPIAIVSLLATIGALFWLRGILKLIPIIIGITAGYIASLTIGIVDFTPIMEASWIQIPQFAFPTFSLGAILFMVPVSIAPALEHFGDIFAIQEICNKNFVKDPGLHRTFIGDGVATSFAALFGGPPNTTYSEVSGAVALLKATEPRLMIYAAITAIMLSFVGKLGALLRTIPVPILGGIEIILFGMIANIGIRHLVKNKVNMMLTRNTVIASTMLVIGIGGAVLKIGEIEFAGIGLAGIVGILLNIILPKEKLELITEKEESKEKPALAGAEEN